MERISYRVALGGIVSAFCLVGMFLTGIFPLLYLVLPMLSGVLLLIIVEEVGTQWAWVTYIAVGLLSLFVTYDKEAALIFVMFFGCYPILQNYINRIPSKIAKTLVKLVFFNTSIVCYFHLNVYLFGMEDLIETFQEWGKYGGLITLIVLNPFFLMYDSSLEGLCELYRMRLRPRISGKH
ncbi:MAG: hypothetical protein V3G42_10615 [Oscillospiraceae bacterium]